MIKNLFSKLIIFSFCFVLSNNSYAATNVKGAATEYLITMTKVEICETGSTISNCLNPIEITVNDGASADIASVAAGETAATVADFSKAPVGKSYTHIQTYWSARSVGYKADGARLGKECAAAPTAPLRFHFQIQPHISSKHHSPFKL